MNPFGVILKRLLMPDSTASEIVDCLEQLRDPKFAPPMMQYLATEFGENPKITRVLIRAAGETSYRPLHDLLAKRLLDDPTSEFTFDLLDALGKTGRPDYAGIVLMFLGDEYGLPIQTTAVCSLGLLGSALAIPALLEVIRVKKHRLRELAIEGLRRILAQQIVNKPLEAYLIAYSPKVRERIRAAIGIRRPRRTIAT